MQELNDTINLIINETQRHANTKERIGKALTLLKNQVEKRVEKQDDKGLSTNDFTNDFKEKLERLQNVDVSHLLEKGTFEGTAQDLKTAIDNVLTILHSPDTTLDTLQEIVDYIKQNRTTLSQLGISNIAGLERVLAEKASAIHSHSWEEITNKPNNLATTQHVDNQIDKIQIGTRNHVLKSKITQQTRGFYNGGIFSTEQDPLFGQVVRIDKNTSGDFQLMFDLSNKNYLKNKDLVYMVIAKPLSNGGIFHFGGWSETFARVGINSNKKELGSGWFCYWEKVKEPELGTGTFGINSVYGSWLFYAVGIFESKHLVDWTPAPEDIQEQITALEDEVYRLKYATEHTANVLNINNSHIGRTIYYKGSTNLTINVANMKKDATFSIVKTHPTAKILFTGKTIVADNEGVTGGAYSSASVVCLGNEVVVLASNR